MNFQNYNLKDLKKLKKKHLKKIYTKSRSLLFKWVYPFFNFIKLFKVNVYLIVGFFLTIYLAYFILIAPPKDFPVGTIITIEEGASLSRISNSLKEQNIVKSAPMFQVISQLLMNGKGVMAGDYFFEKEYPVFKIVWRTIQGDCGITPTKIRVIEGHTIFDIADNLKDNFEKFDKENFLKLAQSEEGYLFPDTYYFLPNVTPEAVIKTMKENFKFKIDEIKSEIADSGKTLEEIVIMASILEKEARTFLSKQKISGILWKRIDIGMPLQVDAVFPYINGKNTYQLSLEDLRTESPYNTYTNKGLPIGPIANPSIYSLLAAATPVESDCLFYLSDRSGNMYYAENFEKHKENKRLYMN